MKNKLYPLIFKPILKERVWGGSQLVDEFHKIDLEENAQDEDNRLDLKHIGESWEIADIYEDQSEVVNGFLAGNRINEIIETYFGSIVGDNIFDHYGVMFPLLIKFLNIEDKISVQSHPDDSIALERYYALGKDELWYVMDAKPGSKIYIGLKRDITAEEFYYKCKDGTIIEVLNEFEPKKGDSFYIKAGTIHSAKGSLLLTEIQQSSDITFRLYDWGRENNPATARDMHLEEAIDCVDLNKYRVEDNYISAADGGYKLVDDKHFVANKVSVDMRYHIETDSITSFIIYICTDGKVEISSTSTDEKYTISKGECVLIPSEIYDVTFDAIGGKAELIEVYMPQILEKKDEYINEDVSEDISPEIEKRCSCNEEDHDHHHHHSGCTCGCEDDEEDDECDELIQW